MAKPGASEVTKPAKPSQPTKKVPASRGPKAEPSPKQGRPDWEAIERDYRTGRFTLRELEAKHGVRHSTISSRVQREGWTQDLADAVRQATRAALIAPSVVQGASSVVQSVQAAAELNKQVILGHRKQLAELQAQAEFARAKLITLGDTVADIKEAAVYVSALEASARTAKIVIEAERKAFNLDAENDKDKPPPADAPSGLEPGEAYLVMVQGKR